jgi:hypothetical protein
MCSRKLQSPSMAGCRASVARMPPADSLHASERTPSRIGWVVALPTGQVEQPYPVRAHVGKVHPLDRIADAGAFSFLIRSGGGCEQGDTNAQEAEEAEERTGRESPDHW